MISSAELARRAGVTAQSISTAIRGMLKPALVGRQILAGHPLVQAYISKHAGRPKQVKHTAGRPRLKDGPPQAHNPFYPSTRLPVPPPSTPQPAATGDPLTCACQIAQAAPRSGEQPPVPVATVGEAAAIPGQVARRQHTNAVLYNLQTQTAGTLPSDLEDLGRMSVREVIDRCGSFEACLSAVKSLKTWAEYQKADVEAKRKRGLLIEKAAVERTVFPYIDLTQRRCLEEVPKAVSQQIIARVLSGGDDLAIDVEKLIQDALARVYRDCKRATVAALRA